MLCLSHNSHLEFWSRVNENPRILNIGSKAWWQNGQLHRLDGPAIEREDDTQEWWIDGEVFSQ